jgi:ribosomal protein S18 acetylase RimI-like enzyme
VRFQAGENSTEGIFRNLEPYLKQPNVFLDAQVDASRMADSRACETAGFRLADTRVQLRREGAPSPRGASSVRLRPARSEDRLAVAALAGKSFRGSRFHQDPSIPMERADALKAAWASNFFIGQRGDGMAVAEAKGQVIGFLLYLLRERTLVIDLVAVDGTHRGQGVGAGLVSFASETAGMPALAVGTQAGNLASLRFYQRLEFRVDRIGYIFHHHGLPAPLAPKEPA